MFIGHNIYSLEISHILGGTANAKLKFFQEVDRPFWEKFQVSGDNVGTFAGAIAPMIAIGALMIKRRESLLPVLFLSPILALYCYFFARRFDPLFLSLSAPRAAVPRGDGRRRSSLLLELGARRDFVVKILVVLGLSLAVIPRGRSSASGETNTSPPRTRRTTS